MNKYKSILIKRRIVSIFLTVLMLVGCIAPLEFSSYAADDGNTTVTDEAAPDAQAPAQIVVPTPKITVCKAGFQRVQLKWKKVSAKDANGKSLKVYYEIRDGKGKKAKIVYMQKSKTSSKLKKAKDLKKTEAWIPFDPYPGKKNGQAKYGNKEKSGEALKATFVVRAYVKNGKKKIYCENIEKKNIKKGNVAKDIEVIHPMYVIVKTKAGTPILKASNSNSKTGTTKSGYYVAFGGSRIKGENKRVIIKVWNKKDNCWDARYIRSRNVSISRYVYNFGKGAKYRFTKKQIEDFINDKKPSSKNNRFIWVNTYNQRVYLFKKTGKKWVIDENHSALPCNTGKELSPYGSYRITGFMARKEKTGTKWWCIFNHVGIHEKLTDALGKPASGGCVRIPDSEAKWYYDNIRGGTGVFVY